MIRKIQPSIVKQVQPIRKNLKAVAGVGVAGLAVLAGSSMSNMSSIPELYPTEMIIPGGLNFQEFSHYLLTHRLPESVYKRWTIRPNNYIPEAGDQVVTINKNGRYIGSIVEGPRRATIDPNEIDDITHDVLSIKTVESDGSLVDVDTDITDLDLNLASELSAESLGDVVGDSAEAVEDGFSFFDFLEQLTDF